MCSFEDDRLMELINEDLLSVSEFGDPCYYEHQKELEQEAQQRASLMKQKYASSSRRPTSRSRREYSYPEDDDWTRESPEAVIMRDRRKAAEINEKNNSQSYRNENIEKLLLEERKIREADSETNKSYRNEDTEKLLLEPRKIEEANLETSKQKPIKLKPVETEPVQKQKEELETIKKEVPKSKNDRKKRNAMLIALEENKKKLLSDSSTDCSKSLSKKLVHDKYCDAIDRTVGSDQNKSIMKTLPEPSCERINVTERFMNLLLDKETAELDDDNKESESESGVSYTTASSASLSSGNSYDYTSAIGVKPKKKAHSTSQRRLKRVVLPLNDPGAPPTPYRFAPAVKKSNFDLKSSSDFPRL